jgi:hypothetical protein
MRLMRINEECRLCAVIRTKIGTHSLDVFVDLTSYQVHSKSKTVAIRQTQTSSRQRVY